MAQQSLSVAVLWELRLQTSLYVFAHRVFSVNYFLVYDVDIASVRNCVRLRNLGNIALRELLRLLRNIKCPILFLLKTQDWPLLFKVTNLSLILPWQCCDEIISFIFSKILLHKVFQLCTLGCSR